MEQGTVPWFHVMLQEIKFMNLQYLSKKTPRYSITCKYCLPDAHGKPQKGIILGVHGFSGSKESTGLKVLSERAVSEGFGLVCFDLPAHWKSPAPPEMLTTENAIQDILFMAEQCRQEFPGLPKFIFATSFGAWLTLLCFQHSLPLKKNSSGRRAGDVSAACSDICVDTGKSVGLRDERMNRVDGTHSPVHPLEDFHIILRAPAVTMPEIFLRLLGMTAEEFKEKAPCECSPDPARPLPLPYSFYESIRRHSVFDAPEDMYPPMLIMHGDADPVVPPGDVRRFCRQYPQMDLHMIPGCGHDFAAPGALDEMCRLAMEYLNKVVK